MCRNILLGVTLDNLYINSNLHSEIFVIPKLVIAFCKSMFNLDLNDETTGVKRPGWENDYKIENIRKLLKVQINLETHKKLIKLKVGTNQIEKQAQNLISEGVSKESRLEKEESFRMTSGEDEEEGLDRNKSKCYRNNRIVTELLKIQEREIRNHKNRVKKIAEKDMKRNLERARRMGKTKEYKEKVRKEKEKLNRELREKQEKKIKKAFVCKWFSPLVSE